MPLPLGRAFSALFRTLPVLIATAISSFGVLAGVCYALFALHGAPKALWLAVPVLFVGFHAAYLVLASRLVARASGLDIKRLNVLGWLRAISTVTVLVSAVGLMITAFTIILFPAHAEFAVFMGTAALVAWTPVLPMIATEGRSVGAAFADSSPELFRFLFSGFATSLPFLVPLSFVVLRLFSSGASWGMFDGGIVMFPILGACIFGAVTTMALISTVVYAAMKPTMEFADR